MIQGCKEETKVNERKSYSSECAHTSGWSVSLVKKHFYIKTRAVSLLFWSCLERLSRPEVLFSLDFTTLFYRLIPQGHHL